MSENERQPVKERKEEKGGVVAEGKERGFKMKERKEEQEEEITRIWRGLHANVEKPFNIKSYGLLKQCARLEIVKNASVCVYLRDWM